MSARKYEGAWNRSASDWYGEDERFTVHGPPDPEHGDRKEAPAPLMMDAPVSLPDAGIFTDAVWEEYEHLPPSVPYDETPVRGHGTPEASGHGVGGLTRPGASPDELGAPRGLVTGAAQRATDSRFPMYRFITDEFFGFFTRGFEPPPIAQMAPGNPVFTRGINSFPHNNGATARLGTWSVEGDGWKRGDYESSAIQRTFFRPPHRHHREIKTVEVDIVSIVGDAPPPEGATRAGDTYASPFSSLQKFLPKRRRIGGLRRDPGPWDEDLVAAVPAGVISPGSADGMVAN